jgi:hypothetical protein
VNVFIPVFLRAPTVLIAGSLLVSGLASAEEPCGGAQIADGVVKVSTPLVAEGALSSASNACVDHLAAQLGARSGLRSVTVTVRVSDDSRVDGSGDSVLKAYVDRLVAGGLQVGRVSGVVTAGDEATVRITYSERKTAQPVGQVVSAGGGVTAGPSASAQSPVAGGARLEPGVVVVTTADGRAVLELADKSRLRMSPDTSLTLGKLYLNEDLQRVVEIRLDRGEIDTIVAPGGAGSSFQISTPYGTAGVRGTTFRVVADDGGATRLETLTGLVELEGASGTASVAALQGARVDSTGMPTEPRALLAAPRVREPLEGMMPASGLRWKKSSKAASYQIEAARDAEFVLEVVALGASSPSVVPDVSAGAWFWRVAAVDGDGFVGAWSEVYSFEAAE